MDNTAKDIRWIQRFNNYRRALAKLSTAVKTMTSESDFSSDIDELLKEGLIRRFEYTHELAWKVMKDYAEYQGYTEIRGSRDAFRKGGSQLSRHDLLRLQALFHESSLPYILISPYFQSSTILN